jgi:hypothetical protein
MFGSQQTPPEPEYSHSFAVFVRACWDDHCPGPPALEAHTISWLPRTLVIRLWALCPEPGHNFDLHTTLRYVLDNKERVSLWGPYQIEPELYHRALKEIGLLQSGRVLYKAIDTGYRPSRVSNCIHAIGSVAGGYRVRVASPGWGETASFVLLRRLSRWIIDENHTHPWVGTALGLDQYPIIYRDFENPRSGLFRGFASRALGLEPTPSYGPPGR